MLKLNNVEIERMCREMDRYYQDAEQALCANTIKTADAARDLASTITEAHAILSDVLKDEKERGENRERVKKMEDLSARGTSLHGQVKELSISLGQ